MHTERRSPCVLKWRITCRRPVIVVVIPLRALPVGTHSEIESVRQRLVQLADNRPYRYKNTTAAARDAYEASKRTFVGFSESEISDCESKLHVRFPAIYRAFLNTMGRKHGDLFCGSNFATLEQLTEHREFAEKLMSENDATWELESNAVVFMEHQGSVSYTHLTLPTILRV